MTMDSTLPPATHLHADDLPWAWAGEVGMQVLRVDEKNGLWVLRNRFKPGFVLQKHYHAGPVHAYTISGRWRYAEHYEESGLEYGPGSFVFEPARSTHTLHIPADNTDDTEVIFVIEGPFILLGESGELQTIMDGQFALDGYRMLVEADGGDVSKIQVLG